MTSHNIELKQSEIIGIESSTTELLAIEEKNKIKNILEDIFLGKKIQKILLINPPDGDEKIFNFDVAKSGRYTNFAPYGIGVIAKHIEKSNYETKILNLNHIILEKVAQCKSQDDFSYRDTLENSIKETLEEFKPDFIGVTCMFSMTHNSVKDVTRILRENSSVPIAAGGVHISNAITDKNTRLKFANDLNYVNLFFLFEAEIAFLEFINIVNN